MEVLGFFCLQFRYRKVRGNLIQYRKYAFGSNRMSYVEFDHVSKIYENGDIVVHALDDVSFHIEKGEICIIVGQSGAGKTTLLNILGGMDSLTKGTIFMDGEEVSKFSRARLENYRRQDIGFVFQFYNLIPNLTALENVEIAAQLCKDALSPEEVLKATGLETRMKNFPAQLSGGEQQRVSIARALAKNPKMLLCDEPTGALDYETGKHILQLLQDCSRKKGMTVVIITHNQALTDMGDRVIRVRNGKIVSEEMNEHPIPIEEIEW